MDALGGEKVKLTIHETLPLSDEATNADKQFGIKGQRVLSRNRGAMKDEEVYLGIACTSGLEKVVVPFIDRGVPVEYELIRSISTVARKERKKVGVLATDARMYGSFNQQTMGMSRNQMIIDELEKQYEVKEVRADSPIIEKFDVLLAVQPSSLSPEQMKNFLDLVKTGQPTAIFEDPFPIMDQSVPGTAAPKQPPGGMNPMMMMQQRQPPQPKGEIAPLWNMLGVQFTGTEVIWQNYNPFPTISTFPPEFVFTGPGATDKPYNDEAPAASNLRKMLFVFPGAIHRKQASDLEFTPLVYTGTDTGTVKHDEIMLPSFFGQGGGLNQQRRQRPTHEAYILACHIKGKVKDNLPMQDAKEKPAAKEAAADDAAKKESQLNVILVADIDVLYSEFFNLRNRGQDEEADVNLDLDNVVFVLNVLDTLAGDDSFVEIRKRHPTHATLTKFEDSTAAARLRVMEAREKFRKEFEEKKDKEQKKLDDDIAKIQKRKDVDPGELLRLVEMAREGRQKELLRKTETLERERDEQIKASEREFARETREKQNSVKFAAVFWPPILPLLMGVAVFFNRRAREREGVSKARLR
jgi:ABC-2 type transport system permease protein